MGNYREFHFIELRASVALQDMEHAIKWIVIYRFLLWKLLDQICISNLIPVVFKTHWKRAVIIRA